MSLAEVLLAVVVGLLLVQVQEEEEEQRHFIKAGAERVMEEQVEQEQ
jgi:hypothetical protein